LKRRRNSRKKRRKLLWVVPAVAAATLTFVTIRILHQKPILVRRRPAAVRLDRAQALHKIIAAIQRAGRQDVWMKYRPGDRENPPNPQGAKPEVFEVLAARTVYDNVFSAALAAAHAQGLDAHVPTLGPPSTLRRSQILLQFRGEAAARFEIYEVRRLVRIAIVVDDLGENPEAARELISLHSPLTFSVMPRLPYSLWTAKAAHSAGEEVMLHLPMQPVVDSAPDISRDELRVGMPSSEVSRIMAADLDAVPYTTGVNNHMGSRATANAPLMADVMRVLASRHLYFIDSRTTPASVALKVAREFGVSSFYRSVFLDDTRSVPYTLGQLHQLCRIAQGTGAALAIGHPYPTTIEALSQFLPRLELQGIHLVPASDLVRRAETVRVGRGRLGSFARGGSP
jgi:polysaccharide deacetylase 2 family uncharacterized protein YibQ